VDANRLGDRPVPDLDVLAVRGYEGGGPMGGRTVDVRTQEVVSRASWR
jgi:hypothetical protein